MLTKPTIMLMKLMPPEGPLAKWYMNYIYIDICIHTNRHIFICEYIYIHTDTTNTSKFLTWKKTGNVHQIFHCMYYI